MFKNKKQISPEKIFGQYIVQDKDDRKLELGIKKNQIEVEILKRMLKFNDKVKAK